MKLMVGCIDDKKKIALTQTAAQFKRKTDLKNKSLIIRTNNYCSIGQIYYVSWSIPLILQNKDVVTSPISYNS